MFKVIWYGFWSLFVGLCFLFVSNVKHDRMFKIDKMTVISHTKELMKEKTIVDKVEVPKYNEKTAKCKAIENKAKAKEYVLKHKNDNIFKKHLLPFGIGFCGFLIAYIISVGIASVTFIPINAVFQSDFTNFMQLHFTPFLIAIVAWCLINFSMFMAIP